MSDRRGHFRYVHADALGSLSQRKAALVEEAWEAAGRPDFEMVKVSMDRSPEVSFLRYDREGELAESVRVDLWRRRVTARTYG